MYPTLSASQMRWSGWILFGGSILLITVNLLGLSLPPISSGLPSIPLSILELIGGLLVTVGLPATYLKQRKEVATLGLVGFFLLWISSFLITVVLSGYAIFYTATTPPPVHPNTAANVPAFIQYIASTGLLQIIGTLLYGSVSLRAHVFTRSAGILLIAAVVVSLPQLFIASPLTALIGLLSTFLLLAGLARMGFSLARWPDDDEEEPLQKEEPTTMKDHTS
jgi:hypothetical protein